MSVWDFYFLLALEALERQFLLYDNLIKLVALRAFNKNSTYYTKINLTHHLIKWFWMQWREKYNLWFYDLIINPFLSEPKTRRIRIHLKFLFIVFVQNKQNHSSWIIYLFIVKYLYLKVTHTCLWPEQHLVRDINKRSLSITHFQSTWLIRIL